MIIPTLFPSLLAAISVLCFIIHRELHKSVKCFITRNSYCIRAVSLDKLPIKSIIINTREVKLDKAFFRYYTILMDGTEKIYLVDLKKKAKSGDVILHRDDDFFIKSGLNYVIDSKFCYVLNSSIIDLESNNIDHFIISFPRRYIQKNYYVLDLKTKIKPGRI